ncbi:hypothetical protein YB2330_003709 [Saitoella coloradoensis]
MPHSELPLEVFQVFVYPIKSCRGISLASARLGDTGFAHDRQFMIVRVMPNGTYNMCTMRDTPRMAWIHTALEVEDGVEILVIQVEGADDFVTIPMFPSAKYLAHCPIIDTRVWAAPVDAYEMPTVCSEYLSEFLGFECKLVYRGPTERPVRGNLPPSSADNARPIVAYADGQPFLIATEESFKDLNSRLPQALPSVIRFRPNIVLKGVPRAWTEDDWTKIRIGGTVFHLTSRCPRCRLPNLDLETAVPDEAQPYKTLQGFRRIDPGSKYTPCFGMNAVADAFSGEIAVGDKAEVLSLGEHFYMKPQV